MQRCVLDTAIHWTIKFTMFKNKLQQQTDPSLSNKVENIYLLCNRIKNKL